MTAGVVTVLTFLHERPSVQHRSNLNREYPLCTYSKKKYQNHVLKTTISLWIGHSSAKKPRQTHKENITYIKYFHELTQNSPL